MSVLQNDLFKIFKQDISLLSSPEQLKQIEIISKLLPPIYRSAIEVRLGDDDTVDFHVNIKTEDDISSILLFFKESGFYEQPKWSPLLHFLELWESNTYDFRHIIPGIFLEYDLSKNDELYQVPSLFVKVAVEKLSAQQTYSLIEKLILTVKGEDYFNVFKALLRQIIFTEKDCKLGYLGFMLSRPEELLRINIYKITAIEVVPFLERCGWKGNAGVVKDWAKKVSVYCDKYVVSFDLYKDAVLPAIGLECFWNKLPDEEPRWSLLLDELMEQNLCTLSKKSLFLEWKKELLPFETQQPWPEHLAIESLLRNEKDFSKIKQLVSHLKISISSLGDISAKAYLGYGNIWLNNSKEKITRSLAQCESSEESAQKAIQFLLSEQQQSGFWKDFEIFKGAADQWVTAYVASALNETNSKSEVLAAINRAWCALKDTFREGEGWGYNFYTPCDGDSTAWSLYLASFCDPSFYMRHKTLIERYKGADGLLTTYVDEEDILRYINLQPESGILGWNSSHLCISGVAAKLEGSCSIEAIASKQNEQGYWQGYWWQHHSYTTYYCLKALMAEDSKFDGQINKARRWWREQDFASIDSIFYRALWVEIGLLLREDKSIIDNAIASIMKEQLVSGSWIGDARIIVPMPNHLLQNSSLSWLKHDVNGIFTTATCLRLLTNYQNHYGKK